MKVEQYFGKDFKDWFIDACNRRDLEPLKKRYKISIEGFKQNIPNFNEVDFIERLIKYCNTIIEEENETRGFAGIRTASIGGDFIRFLRKLQ